MLTRGSIYPLVQGCQCGKCDFGVDSSVLVGRGFTHYSIHYNPIAATSVRQDVMNEQQEIEIFFFYKRRRICAQMELPVPAVNRLSRFLACRF